MSFDDDDMLREQFDAIVEADESLDDVVECLAAAGVTVFPWQRHLLVRWLDMHPANTSVPLASRLVTLKRMIA